MDPLDPYYLWVVYKALTDWGLGVPNTLLWNAISKVGHNASMCNEYTEPSMCLCQHCDIGSQELLRVSVADGPTLQPEVLSTLLEDCTRCCGSNFLGIPGGMSHKELFRQGPSSLQHMSTCPITQRMADSVCWLMAECTHITTCRVIECNAWNVSEHLTHAFACGPLSIPNRWTLLLCPF